MGRAVIMELRDLTLNAGVDTYWRVVLGKTAGLFTAAGGIGGILGGASVKQQQALREAGQAFGCAFQLADDLLDLQESERETGKPLGTDWRQRRATLPVLHALQTAPPEAKAAIRRLWELDEITGEEIAELRLLVDRYGGFEMGWRTVKEYQDAACRAARRLPESEGRQALLRLCGEAFPLPVLPATR